MKNILLFVVFVFSLNLVQAQVEVSISPSPAEASAVLDDPSTHPADIAAKALVTNESSTSKTYTWTRTVVSSPDSWGTAVCDVNLCYAHFVNSETFTLSAGEAATMDVHAYPAGTAGGSLDNAEVGQAVVDITVTEVDNAANTTTARYILTLNATMSSLTSLEIAQLELFPNPAASYFEVRGPEGVATMAIYNLLGAPVETFNYQVGRKFDISNLSKGLYLVALNDDQGQVLKTLRLQKY